MLLKQCVALTGRNRTGPPCIVGRPIPTRPAAGEPTVHVPGGRPAQSPAALGLQTTTTGDNDRRQPAKQYWSIRRASNDSQSTHCALYTNRNNALCNYGPLPWTLTKGLMAVVGIARSPCGLHAQSSGKHQNTAPHDRAY